MLIEGLPQVELVFYKDHQSPNPISREEMSWADVVDLFSEHDRTDCSPCPGGQKCQAKRGLAFSPGIPREGLSRLDRNISHVSMLVYDLDHLTRAELEAVCDRVSGLESILCSTHSHLFNGPDDNCARLIFPLERKLGPTEFRHVYHEVKKRYGLVWVRPGETKLSGADDTTKDLSRLYFLPSAPAGVETLVGHEAGSVLDVDDLLASLAPAISRPTSAAGLGAQYERAPERTSDMEELRKCLRLYRPQHLARDEGKTLGRKELARRVEAGEPLVRPEERGVREESCHRIGKILANVLPLGTSTEAVLELVRPSVMAMPVYEDDGEEDSVDARFAKVGYSFERGLVARAELDAVNAKKLEERRALDQEFRTRLAKKLTRRSADPPTPPDPKEIEETASESEEESPGASGLIPDEEFEGWEQILLRVVNKDGSEGALKNVNSNAEAILAYSPEWRQKLRYNEVTKAVDVSPGTPLDDYETSPSQLTSGVMYWLQRQHGLALRKNDVMDAITHVAKMNAFDPLKDYLNGVVPDGEEYIDTFLEKYCGARTEEGGEDITHTIRKISRHWLLSAVARGLNPGCKADTVMIFEGEQGIKKSTMLRVLGGAWFTDSPISFKDKDSQMIVGCNWIAELSELATVHASDVDTQKSFFSRNFDQFRPPYGYAVEKFLRRCVFAGSTNTEQYHNDTTGNRRFQPVRCDRFAITRARRDRDAIWAHAVSIYKAGFTCAVCAAAADGEDRCAEHRWWMTGAENRALEVLNNRRLKDDYSDVIYNYVLALDPPGEGPPKMTTRPDSYSIYDIATGILGLPADRVATQQNAIGRALKVLGFKKFRPRRGDGTQGIVYLVPDELRNAPKRSKFAVRKLIDLPDPPVLN